MEQLVRIVLNLRCLPFLSSLTVFLVILHAMLVTKLMH
jgi:hypothetical protein